ncbi:MAG: (Fe-S)-binding protein [Thermoplasmatota archaeon]
MKHLEKMKHELMCCTGCGYCKQNCPTLDIGGTEADSGRGKVFLSYGLLTGDLQEEQSLVEALQRCPLCGRCEQDCPSKIPISDIVQTARRDLTTLLPAHQKMVADIREHGTVYGEEQRRDTAGGTVGFFPGCVATHRAPELRGAALTIFSHLDIDATILEGCCGSPLDVIGTDNDRVPEVRKQVAEHDVDTLVVSCPSGLLALQPLAGEVELLHLSEFLLKQDVELQAYEGTLLYHDPSVLGRKLEIYDAPRELLSRAGGFMEFEQHRDLAGCCGGDLAFSAAFDDMADEMARGLLAEAAKNNATVVTASPQCYLQFERHGDVVSLEQVVAACLR